MELNKNIKTNENTESAVVFNIQKFSIHDGPGIRTTVFFKGCPLDCKWCHNPESKRSDIEMIVDYEKCIACKRCVYICKKNAIEIDLDSETYKFKHNQVECNWCGECVYNCVSNAREIIGNINTVDEVFDEIMKDKVFYDSSGGGVTLSGGEPLMQSEFIYKLLLKLKEANIHTAIDTSGFVNFSVFERIVPYTDLFLYDIKTINDEDHKKYIGVSNKLIIENLLKLNNIHNNINIRLVIIEGVNANIAHINGVLNLLKETKIQDINLLPYHDISGNKYKKLGLKYDGSDFSVPSDNKMNEYKNLIEQKGFNVKIGG